MKNAYKIIVKNAQGSAKTLTHDVPAPGSFWGPLKIKATPGARFQLVDVNTGQGPDNIRVKRVGKDLRISFEGRDKVDVMITDYYEHAGNESLVGEVEAGVLHAYVPESGDSAQMLSRLTDGATSTGMALGSEQLAGSGAAVGALVAAAGINPLVAAPLALLGAAGGGGGAGAAAAPLKVLAARLHTEDDTGESNSDGITSDNSPRLLIDAEPGAVEALVTLNGKLYTSTDKNNLGQFIVQIPDSEADRLVDGVYKYTVQVKNAAGIPGPEFDGIPFTIDRSKDKDFPSGDDDDDNKNIAVQMASITNDTGFSNTDYETSDNTLIFKGTLGNGYNDKNENFVELNLMQGTVIVASTYVTAVNSDGSWTWTWDHQSQKLKDGTYRLTAQIVDKAGNAVGSGPMEQIITIDTNATPDSNSKFSIKDIKIDQDSGPSSALSSDFLTNKQALSFKGRLDEGNIKDFSGKVLVQVVGMDGKVISQRYETPDIDGNWSFDNTSQTLGVPGANTQYLLNASIVDLAGNILKSTDQSFTVDLKKPIFRIQGLELSSGNAALIFENMTLVAEEAGTFSYSSQVPLGQPSSTMFGAGTFSISYTDNAGNISTLSNVVPWEFKLATPIVEAKPTTTLPPFTFGGGELAGSIGTYILGPHEMALDLSTFHSTSPGLKSIAALNHIVMADGAANDTLKLTTSDVLVLGVKNSFISTNGFKDRQQMRIDGDAGDKVLLDDLLGGSTFAWVKANDTVALNTTALNTTQNYVVYSNASLGLDLFIQQGIVTTVL